VYVGRKLAPGQLFSTMGFDSPQLIFSRFDSCNSLISYNWKLKKEKKKRVTKAAVPWHLGVIAGKEPVPRRIPSGTLQVKGICFPPATETYSSPVPHFFCEQQFKLKYYYLRRI